jgi:serine/threonine-protein kinase RsbW
VRADLAQVAEDSPVFDNLVLLASELCTNALTHSRSGLPGETFTVRAELRPGRYAWLEVEDQGGEWVSRESDEHRRGLAILACLTGAGNWGVESGDAPGARVVWARLDWPRKAGF